MNNLWSRKDAELYKKSLLGLRVYSSRLLGASPDLVLHGGGNTSMKGQFSDFFGETHETLFVKGSGWDLATIEEEGFSPVKLAELIKLSRFETLSDRDMASAQRAALLEPSAPNPSVEAILHAIIPYKFVDHTHADAVVTLCNTKDGERTIRSVFPELLIIPYVMPGFELAKKVIERAADVDWSDYTGMILMNHGVFTFSDDAQESYESMIEIVTLAEGHIKDRTSQQISNKKLPTIDIAKIRRVTSESAGKPLFAKYSDSALSMEFSDHEELRSISQKGPLTPDHVIRTKRTPLLTGRDNFGESAEQYVESYKQYFDDYKNSSHVMLNPAPKWAVVETHGTVSFGVTKNELKIVEDITTHTMDAILNAEELGGWAPLSPKEIFEVEYWELEQLKLASAPEAKEFEGRIVLVSGGSQGIGRACALEFARRGAQSVSLDIVEPKQESQDDLLHHITCDVTSPVSVEAALNEVICTYGGIDIVVNNAGLFPKSSEIEQLEDEVWERTLAVNLTASMGLVRRTIPFLKEGWDPSIVMICSKNVPAPGPGAGAYSVSKAGLNQLGRIAALELAKYKIRVNMIHPNGVFDTQLWGEDILNDRASFYGMSVEAYRKRNLLSREVKSRDVALMACAMSGNAFKNTTGAQVPVDGGTPGVI